MSKWVSITTDYGTIRLRQPDWVAVSNDGRVSIGFKADKTEWFAHESAEEVNRRIEEAEAPASPRPTTTITRQQLDDFDAAFAITSGDFLTCFKKAFAAIGITVEGEDK